MNGFKNLIKIGHNAKNGYPIKDNPLQLRFVGRALAHLEEGWQIESEKPETWEVNHKGNTTRVHVYTMTHPSGETRRISTYLLKAEIETPMWIWYGNRGPTWGRNPNGHHYVLPPSFADGKTHRVFSTTVHAPGEEYPTLSRSTVGYDRRNTAIGQGEYKQITELGLTRDDPQYINPIAIVPSYAIMAMLLTGTGIAIQTRERSRVEETIETFYNAQREYQAQDELATA